MTAAGSLLVTAAVTDLLSPDDLEKLSLSAASGYRCVTCDRAGQLRDGPAAVVIRLVTAPGTEAQGPQVAHVRLAHSRCSAPQVLPEPGSLAAPPDAAMTATAAVLPHPAGDRALLITEMSVQLSSVTSPGERTDPALAGLLGRGLHLVGAITEPAPDSPGWRVSLPSRATAVILEPDGGLFYSGGIGQPRVWRQLIRRRGQVELLTGVIGLPADGPARPDECVAALAAAARAGRLAGGMAAVR
jgi:hypothetical protein